jgi:epoxide hydrolase-like protein
MEVEPYTVSIPQAMLDDLHERLAHTRWPDEIPTAGWEYGADLTYMTDLVEYWRTHFDWRARERAINAFAHFRAIVAGVGIHFIHEKGRGPAPIPLIITHGWPCSFLEMLRLIPLLTDPAHHGADPRDAFDVIVPSLPGFSGTRCLQLYRVGQAVTIERPSPEDPDATTDSPLPASPEHRRRLQKSASSRTQETAPAPFDQRTER